MTFVCALTAWNKYVDWLNIISITFYIIFGPYMEHLNDLSLLWILIIYTFYGFIRFMSGSWGLHRFRLFLLLPHHIHWDILSVAWISNQVLVTLWKILKLNYSVAQATYLYVYNTHVYVYNILDSFFFQLVENLKTILFHLWTHKIKAAHDQQVFPEVNVYLSCYRRIYRWIHLTLQHLFFFFFFFFVNP